MQENIQTMPWAEVWRWLHRIKGIVCTVQAAATADEGSSSTTRDEIIAEIEGWRAQKTCPANFVGRWALLAQIIDEYRVDVLEADV